MPINYAALSPDGASLACAGDTPTVLLYQAREAGYALSASFTEAHDVGMCCAWSHYGSAFAAAHQDGALAVWDRRSGRLAARMVCGAAARCVKFARGPADLLAVSEHEDRVRLMLWYETGGVVVRCWLAGGVGWLAVIGSRMPKLELLFASAHPPTACKTPPPPPRPPSQRQRQQVHLIDARRWAACDTLLCTPPDDANADAGGAGGGSPHHHHHAAGDEPADISGIAFSPSGRRLWVGARDGCLGFDVDVARRARFSTEDTRARGAARGALAA